MTLKLHGDAFWISPFSFSAYVALREKQQPFEYVPVSLADHEQRKPDYQRRSLTGRVPTLEDGDFWLSESNAIIEYLDEKFPEIPLLPKSLQERARARQIMGWVRSDLGAIREERPTTTMFYARAEQPLSAAGQRDAARLLAGAEQLVTEGATSLFGRFSIADADLAFMLQRLVLNGHDVPKKVRTFAEAVWQRPSVQEFVAHERPPYRAY